MHPFFRSDYKAAKSLYPDIKDIDPLDLEEIEKRLEEDNAAFKTNVYLFAAISAILILFTLPISIYYIYGYTVSLFKIIDANKFTPNHAYTVSTLLGSLGIILYLIFPTPSVFINTKEINKKHHRFRITMLGSTIILLTSILAYCYLMIDDRWGISTFLFRNFLIVSTCTMASATIIYFIISLVALSTAKSILLHNKPIAQKRAEIVSELVDLLLRTPLKGNLYFISTPKDEYISRQIKNISQLIYNFYKGSKWSQISTSIENDFKSASIEFNVSLGRLILTQEDHLNTFQKHLVFYLNIFLSGDLSTLPKAESAMLLSQRRVRMSDYLKFSLYLTLPIIIVIGLKLTIGIEPDQFTKSLLQLLYLIWILVGVFSNTFLINNETKSMIKDIIKSTFGK